MSFFRHIHRPFVHELVLRVAESRIEDFVPQLSPQVNDN